MTLLSLTMAYEHVRAGFGRMALSVLAVALGVALVVAVQLMNGAVLASFLDTVDAVAGRAALTVSAGEGLTFPEEVVERVAGVRGVKLAVPLVRSVAFPDDGSGEVLTVHGVDLAHEEEVRVYHAADDPTEVIEDPLVFLSQPDSVVLTREFAARKGLALESRVALVTPKGVKQFTVRGLLDPQGLAKTLGGRLVVMDLYAAEQAFTAPGQINQIDVLVAEGVSVEAVKAAIGAVLPAGLKVAEPSLRKEVIRKTIGGFQAMMSAFSLLAVVAGFVICYSRLRAIFEARTWEVGLLRAVGLRRSVVFAELLKESLLLGALGIAIGIPVGMVIGRYGLPVLARTTALNFRLPIVGETAVMSGGPFLFGGGVGLLAAALAAVVPALRLAKKQPVAALTMRGREFPAATPARSAAVGLALVGISLALVLLQRFSHLTALGLATTVLIALASCVFAGPFLHHGGHVVLVTSKRLFGAAGEFAVDSLIQGAGRDSLTVATLGVGLGAVLMFGILGWSFERTLVSQLTGRLRADLVVTSSFVSDGYRPSPMGDAVLESLRATPGIALVTAEQERDVPYGSSTVLLDAYDRSCFIDTRACYWELNPDSLPNALVRVARGEAVLVSSSFSHQHQVRPGDFVELESPAGPIRLQVAGVTSGQPVSAVLMSRGYYQMFWNDSLVTWVHITLDPTAHRAETDTTIARRLGERYRIMVRSSADLVAYFAAQARQAFRFTYMLEAITFLLVSLAIADTLASSVVERTRQFGMMRAVGLHRAALFTIVMLEGAAIGALGLFLACLTGLALGIFWVQIQFPGILGWRLDMHVPLIFVLIATTLTLLLCVAGSILPALQAARLGVPQALRNE